MSLRHWRQRGGATCFPIKILKSNVVRGFSFRDKSEQNFYLGLHFTIKSDLQNNLVVTCVFSNE